MSDERVSLVRTFHGPAGIIIATLAIGWVVFHIITAGIGILPDRQLRAVHVGGALFFVLLLYQGQAWAPRLQLAIDVVLALASVIILGYVFVNHDEIVVSNWFINETIEKAFGITLLLIILEAVRRTLGWMFIALILVFFAYAYWGDHIPGQLGHRGISMDRLIYTFYLGDSGVLGMLMGVSATVVTLFLIFGSLLNTSGAGDTFIRIAMRLGGRLRGGAGVVAVIGSALMGMINGSAVANVASTGVMTIPLMKRLGFKRDIAGAIEAVASTGGQIMPPIMGPGAFLMAELLGIPYLDVVTAAVVPSVLFFCGLLLSVYLMALRYDLQALPENMIPTWRQACPPLAALSLALPIVILLTFIIQGYTVQRAAFWAIVSILLMMVGIAVASRQPLRNLSVSGELTLASTGPEASVSAGARRESEHPGRRLMALARNTAAGLYGTALSIVYIAMIMVAAQIMVSVINLTGLGVTFAQIILELGGQSIVLSLGLTMALAIILGMGMPTPAAYAVGAAVLAPPLINLGFGVLPAHMFLYFFACVAAITPPVAAGIFAAIAISGGTFLGTARYALILACSLFIIPYAFILNPVLMLTGAWTEIVAAVISATAGVGLLSVAVIGYFKGSINVASRIIMAAGACAMIVPGWMSDLIGIGSILFAFGLHCWRGSVVRNRVTLH